MSPVVTHIVLVGLPGAGKSTVGREVAARLGRPFVDLDAEIERREGRAVGEIFAERGEGYFRERERAVTEELIGAMAEPVVLATGGGWVTNEGVVAHFRGRGRIMYLVVSPERALARLGADRGARPLLAGPDPLAALHRLLEAREALYTAAADDVLPTDLLDLQQVADMVAELASGFEGR